MWIYDGEEWTDEGGSGEKSKPDSIEIPFDKFVMPELQVIEIVPTTTHKPVPPFPMP